MTEIVVSADTETWVTRPADPGDDWDAGDTGGRVTGVSAWVARDFEKGRSGWGSSWYGHLDVQIGDVVYAVVADYESGSTFGRDGGYAQVVDVFTDHQKAFALAEAAKEFRSSYSMEFEFDGVKYFAQWEGYFEYLNDIQVWVVKVEDRG